MSKKVFDAFGNEVKLTKDSFEFVQKDKKISDTKLESKPTTFIKDAFVRFRKNKSSVVGAIILGVLALLTIIVPIVSPYNISDPELKLAFLEPKLFEAGTGFWDGTLEYTNQLYDINNETPVGFRSDSVVKITNLTTTENDQFSEYGYGGTLVYEADGDTSVKRGFEYLYHTKNITIDTAYEFKIEAEFDDVDTTKYDVGEFRIVLSTGKLPNSEADVAAGSKIGIDVILSDWTSLANSQTINVSEKLKEAGYDKLENAHFRIDLKNNNSGDKRKAAYINSFIISSNNEELSETLDGISIKDGNSFKLAKSGDLAYWACSGVTSAVKVNVSYCDFVYDVYNAQLGVQSNFAVGQSIMEEYIAKGYCSYDFDVGVDSFVILDDMCPITKVTSQKSVTVDGTKITNLTCDVVIYKYLGFEKMPKFLFGTNSSGYDLVKQVFTGLSTSFLLAIAASAVNFTIGLIWGSISGYFGGNVDLAMERFCEILGGMPWIVMMTLVMLLLGRNLFTFALALCLTGWMGTAGRTRTQFYRFKGREYILSSRTLGSSDFRLIFKHILPNALGTIVTGAVLMIPSVIFSEATLAYLNLFSTETESFGVILSVNQNYLGSHPALILFPSVIISLIMISFNLFGNGLRDALNPSLKGVD